MNRTPTSSSADPPDRLHSRFPLRQALEAQINPQSYASSVTSSQAQPQPQPHVDTDVDTQTQASAQIPPQHPHLIRQSLSNQSHHSSQPTSDQHILSQSHQLEHHHHHHLQDQQHHHQLQQQQQQQQHHPQAHSQLQHPQHDSHHPQQSHDSQEPHHQHQGRQHHVSLLHHQTSPHSMRQQSIQQFHQFGYPTSQPQPLLPPHHHPAQLPSQHPSDLATSTAGSHNHQSLFIPEGSSALDILIPENPSLWYQTGSGSAQPVHPHQPSHSQHLAQQQNVYGLPSVDTSHHQASISAPSSHHHHQLHHQQHHTLTHPHSVSQRHAILSGASSARPPTTAAAAATARAVTAGIPLAIGSSDSAIPSGPEKYVMLAAQYADEAKIRYRNDLKLEQRQREQAARERGEPLSARDKERERSRRESSVTRRRAEVYVNKLEETARRLPSVEARLDETLRQNNQLRHLLMSRGIPFPEGDGPDDGPSGTDGSAGVGNITGSDNGTGGGGTGTIGRDGGETGSNVMGVGNIHDGRHQSMVQLEAHMQNSIDMNRNESSDRDSQIRRLPAMVMNMSGPEGHANITRDEGMLVEGSATGSMSMGASDNIKAEDVVGPEGITDGGKSKGGVFRHVRL